MKKEEFIQKIAGYVKKYAAAYEIKVPDVTVYSVCFMRNHSQVSTVPESMTTGPLQQTMESICLSLVRHHMRMYSSYWYLPVF